MEKLCKGLWIIPRLCTLPSSVWGYFRSDQQKIREDVLDVISLLLYGDIDLGRFKQLVELYRVPKGRSVDVLLEYIDKIPQVQDFIDMDANKIESKMREYKRQLKSLFEV